MRDGAVVARRAHNPKVISSSLVPATKGKALHYGVRLFFVPMYLRNLHNRLLNLRNRFRLVFLFS